MLGRGTEISMSELFTDLNFLYFKAGRDRCSGDANAGIESQSLCNVHALVLAAVYLFKRHPFLMQKWQC